MRSRVWMPWFITAPPRRSPGASPARGLAALRGSMPLHVAGDQEDAAQTAAVEEGLEHRPVGLKAVLKEDAEADTRGFAGFAHLSGVSVVTAIGFSTRTWRPARARRSPAPRGAPMGCRSLPRPSGDALGTPEGWGSRTRCAAAARPRLQGVVSMHGHDLDPGDRRRGPRVGVADAAPPRMPMAIVTARPRPGPPTPWRRPRSRPTGSGGAGSRSAACWLLSWLAIGRPMIGRPRTSWKRYIGMLPPSVGMRDHRAVPPRPPSTRTSARARRAGRAACAPPDSRGSQSSATSRGVRAPALVERRRLVRRRVALAARGGPRRAPAPAPASGRAPAGSRSRRWPRSGSRWRPARPRRPLAMPRMLSAGSMMRSASRASPASVRAERELRAQRGVHVGDRARAPRARRRVERPHVVVEAGDQDAAVGVAQAGDQVRPAATAGLGAQLP